ncbi:hypothetical protein IX38_02285 [Chryseobacterium luteum]|uniref:Uncharacterized protein n=1 Tax=Chryseobacterium luteum TaxID=421531 RepID=A0A085ZY40_9FLAO|nr:hypothetical protein IX38_02285 [Chryseobacterium luteum]
MINFLLIFFGLVSTNNDVDTSFSNQNQATTPLSDHSGNINPRIDNDGDTGGNTGQLPPPFTQP